MTMLLAFQHYSGNGPCGWSVTSGYVSGVCYCGSWESANRGRWGSRHGSCWSGISLEYR